MGFWRRLTPLALTPTLASRLVGSSVALIGESPLDPARSGAGPDEGNGQLRRDAGGQWSTVVGNVPGLPKASGVSWVEASRFEPGTAYAAFDRHAFGDMAPWVYRTQDF